MPLIKNSKKTPFAKNQKPKNKVISSNLESKLIQPVISVSSKNQKIQNLAKELNAKNSTSVQNQTLQNKSKDELQVESLVWKINPNNYQVIVENQNREKKLEKKNNLETKIKKPLNSTVKTKENKNSSKLVNFPKKESSQSQSENKIPKVEIIFLCKSKIARYFDVIHEMFAFIKTKKRLGEVVQKMNENQETYYVGLLVDGSEMGFCEFNITYQLWDEKICYVNHLIVSKKLRGIGLGTQVLDFVIDFAKAENCEGIELRSDLFRKKAHTFYYKKGFGIDCFNFRKNLK